MTTDLHDGADLHDLMEHALSDLPTPTARLHAGALRHGRPLRRRQRAIGGLAAAAVVAAIAAVAVPFVDGTGSRAGDVASEPPRPPRAEVPFVSHPGWWDMRVGPMRARLLALLPDDVDLTSYEKVNTDHGPGETDAWSGVLRGTLRDATDVGPGSIEIFLVELPQDPSALADLRRQHLSCDPDVWDLTDPEDTVHCETGDVHGGRPYQRTATFTDQGVTYTEVRRWTGDGEIYAAVSNSTQRKWGPPASAVRAPLTLPELVAVVDSASWTDEQ